MNIINAIWQAIVALLEWMGQIFLAFGDWFGISGWIILALCAGIIGLIIKKSR